MIVGDSGVRFSPWQGISTVRCRAVSAPWARRPFPPCLWRSGARARGRRPPATDGRRNWPQDEEAPANRDACDPSRRGAGGPREGHPLRLPGATKPGVLVGDSPTIIHGEPNFYAEPVQCFGVRDLVELPAAAKAKTAGLG